MKNTIEIKNLCKNLKDFEINHLSLSLPTGSIMGLIGKNGAGKTTLFKLILDILSPDSGDITILGASDSNHKKEIKNQIGFVPDSNIFYDMFQARDVHKIYKNAYRQWDEALFFQYLEQFEIPLNKSIQYFSMGMKKKLLIATAFSHHPKLLLLDEPMSGLDPVARNEISDLLLDFMQDESHSILISSHITKDLEKIADYITFISKGNIILNKNKDQILEEYGVLKCKKQDFPLIDKTDYIGWRENAFGCEVMVKNRRDAQKKYKNMVIDSVDLESIMVFYERGNEK